MSRWRTTPLAGFDLEATGVDIETAAIVTACVAWANPTTGTWSPVNWLLRQDKPIPAEATAVHGITTEQANTEGIDHATGLAEIRDALYTYWDKGWPVCGYNHGSYDLTLLDRELRRHNLGGLEIRGLVIDAHVIDKKVDRYRRGSRKLIDTCTHYGITLDADDAHGAEPDALAATRLAWKLAPHLPDDPEQAMAWQAQAYAEQRRSFADYLRKQGKHDDAQRVAGRTAWPMEPWHGKAAA